MFNGLVSISELVNNIFQLTNFALIFRVFYHKCLQPESHLVMGLAQLF